ncbi:acyltransferase family protein [Cellulomonas humilata]|uniref:Peptidoglycan/LPS O-acetylase OafA/YrhL n=1 Tax=Cellulomonas humilata TaxID=144055 RepID=A0ABU0EDB3_9CELL|nr:acyltransferase [Cellulomonas humilata]MDQ0373257.1 peptidoglycan/LPS O-acetylase OafA/YrhL [Cellulomonas humilata]
MTAATTSESPSLALPPAPRPSGRSRLLTWGASELQGRNNGLNLIRLVLAYSVLVAHGWYLAGKGVGPQLNGQNMGGWAVMGFFAISGYLITGSRLTKPLGDYLVLRIARIFPAFLVCLVVTALVFAPLAFVKAHGSLDGFFTTPFTPANYIFANAGLRIIAFDVAGTPTGVPYPAAWSGSLWTLYYEFLCYLIIAALLCFVWVRRRPWVVFVAMLVSIVGYGGWPQIAPYFGGNADLMYLLQLIPFFLAGSFLYMVKDKFSFTWPLALLAAAVGFLIVLNVPGWGPQLAAPLLAYVIMWAGAVIPAPRLVQKHDVSYGVYIYAWPVQQLLALAGLYTLNLAVYDLLAIVCTLPLAIASWLLIERPVLRRARKVTTHARPPAVLAPVNGYAPVVEESTESTPSSAAQTMTGSGQPR